MATAVIPAKMISSRIPSKNMIGVGEYSLIEWTLDTAINWDKIERIIVVTDNENIARIAKQYKAEVLPCDAADISDCKTTSQLWMQMSEMIEGDTVLLQLTTPFRKLSELNEQWSFFKDNDYDIVISVSRLFKALFNHDGVPELSPAEQLVRLSQKVPPRYCLEGSSLLASAAYLRDSTHLYEGRVGVFEVDPISTIDIDYPADLEFARLIAASWKLKNYLN